MWFGQISHEVLCTEGGLLTYGQLRVIATHEDEVAPEKFSGYMRVLIRSAWAQDSTMKRTRQTPVQIIRKFKTSEQLIAKVKTIVNVCFAIEVTRQKYHR